LLDRSAQPPCGVDIRVEVPRVDYDRVLSKAKGKLTDERFGEPSSDIRARVEKARQLQRQRSAGRMGGAPRGHDPAGHERPRLPPHCKVPVVKRSGAKRLTIGLARLRSVKLARTIAGLEGVLNVK
jgi:predicted ATPase with chaperone activity